VIAADLPHGFRCLHLGAVPSTNDVARGHAERGEAAGLFVVADAQTAGRGRQGRTWQSPPGNLYASLILRPQRPMAEAASLSLVVALALAEAVEALSAGRAAPRLKWPNDVQVEGGKIAGILLEAAAGERGHPLWLVVGIGVNVLWSPGAAVPYPTTHLAACGLDGIDARSLLVALTAPLRRALDRWAADGFAPLRAPWLARAAGLGAAAEVRLGDEIVQGRLVDVDATGALRLEDSSGAERRFTAGEMLLV
jgi:BirA family biotin operon repressor/biotin-[acetyl-CoA-carboxylase] ligase